MLTIIFTALLSGLFSGVWIFALNESKDRSQSKLKRLEDVSVLYVEWSELSVQFYSRAYSFGQDKLPDSFESDNQRLDLEYETKLARLRVALFVYTDVYDDVLLPTLEIKRKLIVLWRDAKLAHLVGEYDQARIHAENIFKELRMFLNVQAVASRTLMLQTRAIAEKPTLLDRLKLISLKSKQRLFLGTPSDPRS